MKKALSIIIIGITILTIMIKNIETTEYGTLITFRNNTGYFIEK